MISKSDALRIVQAELDQWAYGVAGDSLMLLESKTKEKPYAWVIYWTSRRWYETRDIAYAVAGAGPFIVSKQTGRITQYSGAYGTKSALEKYEEEEMLYGLRVTADLTDTNSRLLLKKRLLLSNQELLRIIREPMTWVTQGAQVRLETLRLSLLEHGLGSEVVPCF